MNKRLYLRDVICSPIAPRVYSQQNIFYPGLWDIAQNYPPQHTITFSI
ncbi:MAG: hypothetical protein QM727_05465 [Niabella sp.]